MDLEVTKELIENTRKNLKRKRDENIDDLVKAFHQHLPGMLKSCENANGRTTYDLPLDFLITYEEINNCFDNHVIPWFKEQKIKIYIKTTLCEFQENHGVSIRIQIVVEE